jgi:hypothetical protein
MIVDIRRRAKRVKTTVQNEGKGIEAIVRREEEVKELVEHQQRN